MDPRATREPERKHTGGGKTPSSNVNPHSAPGRPGPPPVPPKIFQETSLAAENRDLVDQLNKVSEEYKELQSQFKLVSDEKDRLLIKIDNLDYQAGRNLQQKQLQQPHEHQQLQQQHKTHSWFGREISEPPDVQIRRLREESFRASESARIAEARLQQCRMSLERTERENREGVEYYQKENSRLSKQAQFFQTEIQRMQEKSIREMADGRWGPVPDEIIRDRLKFLYSDIRDWAKRWAGGPIRLDILSSDALQREFVESYLPQFVRTTAEGHLPRSISNPLPKMKEKLASILLTAAVCFEIQSEFFENPFFCIDGKRVQTLQEMHDELIDANPREGHIWRSIMWRLMNPPPAHDRTAKDKEISLRTSRLIENLCNRIGQDFKKGPARLLLRQESDEAKVERAKSLRQIFTSAAEIATSLWTQRPYLSCHDLGEFRSRKMAFHVASPIMEAHPLSQPKVDYDDPKNNDRKIGIVVRPALLAFDEDDHEGFEGNAYRILAKAVVWLEE